MVLWHRRDIITISITVTLLVTAAFIWSNRYEILYNQYLYKAEYVDEPAGKWMLGQIDNIEAIAPYVLPQMENTYKDVNQPEIRRALAGHGLLKADRKRAVEIFESFLESDNEEAVFLAIADLRDAKSSRPYKKIKKLSSHPDANIRRMVAYYIGKFKTDESISLLKYMQKNDPDEFVREAATHSLRDMDMEL